MATTKIEYIGPLRPSVILAPGTAHQVVAPYGEPIDVDAELADSLLQQPDNWREPKPGPKPAPKHGGES